MEDLDAVVERIKGRITDFLKPNVCWPWTGARTASGPRMQKMRDRDNVPFYQPVIARSFGLVKVEGKRIPVHKIIYEWSNQQLLKTPSYRLYNKCSNTLCCNPQHWRLHDREAEAVKSAAASAPADPDLEMKSDCAELLEALLAVTQPRGFADIQNHPYMVDFPPAVIKEVLRALGKDYLCS
jgi:hypothetical protein